MVAAKGFLQALNSTLEGLEKDLDTQAAQDLRVPGWASGLIDELRKLLASLG
jgi:hypothetical protein